MSKRQQELAGAGNKYRRAGALHGFFNALAFFTRLPCPGWVDYGTGPQRLAARFAPLIGSLVGLAAAAGFALATSLLLLPSSVAVVLALVIAAWLTGALHEDGFADVCDGFGAGGDRGRTLTIMQDPRCGSFAVLGLGLLLLLKFALLSAAAERLAALDMLLPGMTLLLVAGHALSRFAAVATMSALRYVSSGRRAGAMTAPLGACGFTFAAVCGLAPLAGFGPLGLARLWLAVLPVLLVWLYLARLFQCRLGGYSGDCLGAVQQLTETAFYLAVCVLLAP